MEATTTEERLATEEYGTELYYALTQIQGRERRGGGRSVLAWEHDTAYTEMVSLQHSLLGMGYDVRMELHQIDDAELDDVWLVVHV